MGQIMFGLPRSGPWTSNLCIATLTIIAATIGPALRNTLESTPKDLKIKVAKNIMNVRRNGLMPRNQILLIR